MIFLYNMQLQNRLWNWIQKFVGSFAWHVGVQATFFILQRTVLVLIMMTGEFAMAFSTTSTANDVLAVSNQTPPPVDFQSIADLDGDTHMEMLVSNVTYSNHRIELVLSQSGEHIRLMTLGVNEIVVWENCKVVDNFGCQGSRGILISTEEKDFGSEWIIKCRLIDSKSLLLLGQAVGLQESEAIESVFIAQLRGDTNFDDVIDMLDFENALSAAPSLCDDESVQHRAFVGAADMNIDGMLDIDDFVALTLSMEDSSWSLHQATAATEWRTGFLQGIIDFLFPCTACARECGGLLLQLENLVNDCNARLQDNGCAECLQSSDPPCELELFIPCYQQWNDCYTNMMRLASGSVKCMCIYRCGPKLLNFTRVISP